MQIQLTKDFLGNSAGQRLDVADHDAQTLLDKGIAQPARRRSARSVLQRSDPARARIVDREGAGEGSPAAHGQSRRASALRGARRPDPRRSEGGIQEPRRVRPRRPRRLHAGQAYRRALQPHRQVAAGHERGYRRRTAASWCRPTSPRRFWSASYAQNNLLAMTDTYVAGGNSVAFPRNAETSRANGSRWGGVRAYWAAEGDQGTGSFPTYSRLTLNMNKLFVMVNATDELMSDTQGTVLEQYLTRVAGEEINFVVSDAIMNGSGTGQPLGILAAPALLTVAKDVSQAAATVSSSNIANMWARLWAGCRGSAVWLINQDVESQLQQMTIGSGASTPVRVPAAGRARRQAARNAARPAGPADRMVRRPRHRRRHRSRRHAAIRDDQPRPRRVGSLDPSPLRLRRVGLPLHLPRRRPTVVDRPAHALQGDEHAVVLRRLGDAIVKKGMKDEG